MGYEKIEYKYKDRDSTGTSASLITSGGTCFAIAVPAQGSDLDQRIGRETVTHSIYIKGYIMQDAVNLGQAGAFGSTGVLIEFRPSVDRLIVFADYQCNGGTPLAADLLMTSDALSHINLDNRNRFKILGDFIYDLGSMCGNTAQDWTWKEGKQLIVVKEYINCYNMGRDGKGGIKTVYKGTGGTVADIATGGIFALWTSTRAKTTTGQSCLYRIKFSG